VRIYFAHPVTDYGTERERGAVAAIEAEGWTVENPNQPHHQAGYDEEGMVYFERLAASCDALIFMRFPGGAIGAGVGKEIDAAQAAACPIYELFDGEVYSVYGSPTPVLSVENTRALLAEIRATEPNQNRNCKTPVKRNAPGIAKNG